MKAGFKRVYLFGQRGQSWDAFFLFFVFFTILFSLAYFFIFKFDGIPTIKPKREIRPAERGVLPKGTFFPPSSKPRKPVPSAPKRRLQFLLTPTFAATTQPRKPVFSVPVLETYLTANFSPNAILETDTVTFKLSGKNLTDPKERVGFEILLFPVEKNWTRVGTGRTYTKLKRGGYIFFSRAVNTKGIVDRTPAFIPFQIKVSDAYKKVSLSYSSRGNQLTLTNISRQALNVTDWKISSFAGNFTVPTAVKIVEYFFGGAAQTIILAPNERLILTTNDSPIGLDAFKPNRCFRFLTRTYKLDFSTGLCKIFSRDELFRLRRFQGLSDRCINFIQAHSCSYPTDKELKPIQAEYSCYKFVWDNLTYRGCVENNRTRSDFLTKEWRVYVPTTKFNFSRFDEIRIVDSQGLLITSRKIY